MVNLSVSNPSAERNDVLHFGERSRSSLEELKQYEAREGLHRQSDTNTKDRTRFHFMLSISIVLCRSFL